MNVWLQLGVSSLVAKVSKFSKKDKTSESELPDEPPGLESVTPKTDAFLRISGILLRKCCIVETLFEK